MDVLWPYLFKIPTNKQNGIIRFKLGLHNVIHEPPMLATMPACEDVSGQRTRTRKSLVKLDKLSAYNLSVLVVKTAVSAFVDSEII